MLNSVCFTRCVDSVEIAFISICLKSRYFVYINATQFIAHWEPQRPGPGGGPNHLAPALDV